jgi:hypothetical protein
MSAAKKRPTAKVEESFQQAKTGAASLTFYQLWQNRTSRN